MKVKCVGYKREERYFTIGKVYEWEDGKLRSDNGYVYDGMVSGEDPSLWMLSEWYDFEVVKEREFIVIRRNGQEVIAEHHIGKKIVKSASARCNPEDKFVFEKGADIACARLCRKAYEEQPLYEGKVVCIDNSGNAYTVGKLYQFKNGCIKNDKGILVGKHLHIRSFDEWNRFSSATWLEIAE